MSFEAREATMKKAIRTGILLCCLASGLAACGSSSGGKPEACKSTIQATCIATDSCNGYGKCVLEGGACAAPSAVSACATYLDEKSCTAACTWADGACTGPTGGTGLECAEYTTQAACEIPCEWTNGVCIVE